MLSVTAYGAKGNGVADDTPAFEAAFQDASASLTALPGPVGRSAGVFVPEGSYRITRGLYLPYGIDLVGEGWGSCVWMDTVLDYPIVTVGVQDPGVTPADRPDLFGVMDATLASRAGQRWGFSTAGGLHLQTTGGPSHGTLTGSGWSYWGSESALCLDLAFTTLPTGLSSPICGIGQSGAVASPWPWALQTHDTLPGWATLYVASSAIPGEWQTNDGRFDFPLPAGSRRLTVQLDLAKKQINIWLDEVLTMVSIRYWPSGSTFRTGYDWPLQIGVSGMGPDQAVPTPLGLAGIWIGCQPRYAWGSSPQARLDGQPMADGLRYASRLDPGFVAYLDATSPPGQRWMSLLDSTGSPWAAQICRGAPVGGEPNAIRNLYLSGRGDSVLIGSGLNTLIDHCRLESGYGNAIGSVHGQNSYPVTVRDCDLTGNVDAAIRVDRQALNLIGGQVRAYGRHGVWIRSMGVTIERTFFGEVSPQTEAVIRWLPGTGYNSPALTVANVNVDNESATAWQRSALVVDQPPDAATRVDIRNFVTGKTQGRPVVELTRRPGALQSGSACVRWAIGTPQPDILYDPAAWRLEIEVNSVVEVGKGVNQ